MIQLVKTKISALSFLNQESFNELTKLTEITKIVIDEKSKECSPPYNECLEAIRKINQIDSLEKNQTSFESIKSKLLQILTELLELLNQIDETPSIDVLLHGQKIVNFDNDLKFELLLVEQNNINYFKSRPRKFLEQEHERLYSHIWIYKVVDNIKLGFNSDSDLPQIIRVQITDVFEKIVQKHFEVS